MLGDLVSVLQLPDDPHSQRYFFAGLAFLAGFSERFAQDIVAQGKAAGVAQAPTMRAGAVRLAPPRYRV